MIAQLIDKAIEINDSLTSYDSEKGEAVQNCVQIPTLKPDFYRNISPMLKERFDMMSYWKNATHGDWLSIEEMVLLWKNERDPYIAQIKHQLRAFSDNWINDASSLFKEERISVFAIEENGNEHIYLVWFDDVVEPEFWVYDSNGMARYEHLECYLNAYISDDLSAYENHWILGC
jgi:hypothetical protein